MKCTVNTTSVVTAVQFFGHTAIVETTNGTFAVKRSEAPEIDQVIALTFGWGKSNVVDLDEERRRRRAG